MKNDEKLTVQFKSDSLCIKDNYDIEVYLWEIKGDYLHANRFGCNIEELNTKKLIVKYESFG